MASSTTTKTVILDQPSNWEPWLFVVQTMAEGGDIWEYINPDLDTDPIIPNRPQKPNPQDVNATKNTLIALDAPERETFKLLLANYKEDLAVTKQILDTIQAVRTHIVSTVGTKNIVYIKGKTTVFQMLVALKKRLRPTDYARKLDVVRKYNKLKTYSKRDNVEKWLKDWETTFEEGKNLKIPEVADERSLFDFTHAISAIDSGYSTTQEYFINLKIKNSETLPELYDLVEDFRNHYRRTEALKTSASHSAFATLNGESQSGESQNKERTCLCGGKHENGKSTRWEKCEYITPENRPSSWKGKPETFEKINKVIKTWDEEDSNGSLISSNTMASKTLNPLPQKRIIQPRRVTHGNLEASPPTRHLPQPRRRTTSFTILGLLIMHQIFMCATIFRGVVSARPERPHRTTSYLQERPPIQLRLLELSPSTSRHQMGKVRLSLRTLL